MSVPYKPCSQRGFALLMALIFLVLMSLLAITASRHALLQERMAGSLRNALQARMSAETALRGAEYKLWSMAAQAGAQLHCRQDAISSDDGCVVYHSDSAAYAPKGNVTRFQSASGWLPDIGVAYLGPARRGYTSNPRQPTAELAENPMYVIEDLGRERAPATGGMHESGNTGPNADTQDHADIHLYRVTARATGGKRHAVSIVQSTFDAPAAP